jgi:beta-lactamase regulating signal transducer with metallopeptidase domain
MNLTLDRFVQWIVDLHILSSLLLLAGLLVLQCLKQPAARMAVSRSILMGLASLTLLVAAPGWPRGEFPTWAGDDVAITSSSFTQPIEPDAGELPAINVGEPVGAAPTTSSPNPRQSPTFVSRPEATFPGWRSVLLSAYVIGATLNAIWLALGAFQAARLRRSVRTAESRVPTLLTRVVGDSPTGTRVCLSERLRLPVAFGVLRPIIVLPEQFAANEPDDALEAALAHELAHIQNGDLKWLAFIRVLVVVYFAQPLFWLLKRTIRADQEALADARAATLHGDGRLEYAQTLVAWARSANGIRPGAMAAAALALWERPSMLKRRVTLLLDPNLRVAQSISRRWRATAIGLGLLLALALSLFTVRPVPASAQVMKAGAASTKPTVRAESKSDKTAQVLEYAGRVLGPDGQPVAGAGLHLAYFRYLGKVRPPTRATSDADGRFRFTMTKQDFTNTDSDSPWTTATVVATRDGFGLGWADAAVDDKKSIDPLKLTIRLASDDQPIVGRIVDLQGKPVADVSIQLGEIRESEQGDLSSWIDAATRSKGESGVLERAHLARKLWAGSSGVAEPIVTNSDGRFSIHGIGRERLIQLKVSGPTIHTKDISVLTRSTEPFRVNHGRGSPDWGVSLYYGATFTHAAAPAKMVVGVVKDKETGVPLAGVRIECNKTAEYPVFGATGIETTSDQQGRYRLAGLPKGRGNHVVVIPAKNQPYRAAGYEIPDSPGLERVVFDILLTRGIVIEGRVFDNSTGKPLKAYVEYNAYRDNPNLKSAPEFVDSSIWGRHTSEPDGSFRVVGLPGRGLVSALCIGGEVQYVTGFGLPENQSVDELLPVVPNPMQMSFNAFAPIDLPEGSTRFRQDLAVQPGVTRTIRVVDPDGKPVVGARIRFQPRVTNFSGSQSSAEFQVSGLRPREVRVIDANHLDRKLAGTVEVRAEDQGVAILKLLPWGTVVGKLVDADGLPRAKVDLELDKGRQDLVPTDSQGHFRLESIVPGRPTGIVVLSLPYRVTGKIATPLTLVPGEVKDLGEVREKKDEE